MPEPSKRVVLLGVPAIEKKFRRMVSQRVLAEEEAKELDREAQDLAREAERDERELRKLTRRSRG